MTFQADLLFGRTALITGGGTGICRGIALALAAHGCDVAIMSRSAEHLAPTADEIRATGRRAVAVPADVRDPAAVEAAVTRIVEELGGLDILSQWRRRQLPVSGGAAVAERLRRGGRH